MPTPAESSQAPAAPAPAPAEASTPAPAAPAPAPAAPAPAAPAAPAAAPAADDADFSAAFAELTKEPTPASAAPAPAPAAPATPPAAPAVPAEAPAPAPAAPATPTPPADPAALQATIEQLRAQLAERTPAAPAAAPAHAEAPAPAPAPVYTAEETAAIAKYREEWPEVAAAEALVRRAEYQQVVAYVFNQFAPILADLQASHATVSTRTQYSAIKELEPDYDAVRDPVIAWIDTQPAYLAAAFKETASKGTPEDIVDMIRRFKKETNWVAPAAAPGAVPATPAAAPAATAPAPAAPAPAPAAPAASPAVAAAVASLRPVASARSEPTSGVDENDFDGAFKEFAAVK